MTKNKLSIGGLCSGVGGIELGFQKAGFDISWANDMDKNAMVTYESIIGKNHYIGERPMLLENIIIDRKLSPLLTRVDVLAAGFPCQAFSLAGLRKGFDDNRGNVFFKIRDIVKFLKNNRGAPKVLFLENVKNFRKHDNENTFKTVKKEIESLGYSVYTKIINTSKFSSIPQNRERTFMICFYKEKKWRDYQLDRFDDSVLSDRELSTIKRQCPSTFKFHELFKNIKSTEKNTIWKYLDNASKVNDKYFYTKLKYPRAFSLLDEAVVKKNTIYQYRRVYVRENQSNECPTLTANMGTGGHNVPIVLVNKKNKRYRKLTPEECFRFQGYGDITLPKKVADGQLYKQAGNSVTVPIIKKLASLIKLSIDKF
ncbi:DNA (cytosine-5-)-methyltransferase [Candidatus Marinimicrobia bacterium]|nr:DNA (cytosine-5-)-methyltransferase [Candidatus Neomarinimicrobiota bacterium]